MEPSEPYPNEPNRIEPMGLGLSQERNPYEAPPILAATQDAQENATGEMAEIRYDLYFFMSLGLVTLFAILTLFYFWPITVLMLWVIAFGAVRVPIVLRRRQRMYAGMPVKFSPTLTLWLSWLLVSALTVASVVAFCVICVPASFVVFDSAYRSGGNSDSMFFAVFFGSGAVGLLVFAFGYLLTLRI